MATTTTVHAQLIRYTTGGDQIVINLKTTASDVSVDRTSNSKIPSSVSTAQGLADVLGNLAFKDTIANATTSASGLMTAAMVTKLNGIASGANAYSHPTYTSRAAGLYKITVDGTGHVSAATAVGKADITALGIPGQDTTYGVFAKATADANGGSGLVPAPTKGQQGLYLRGDGTWGTPTNTVYTHPNSGVTAGTYRSVTVNAQGHVTAGTNPTTLAGYGITDAAAKSHTHSISQITDNIPASKITGVLSLDNIPKSAVERVVPVTDDAARLKLTSADVQNGDVVKVTSTGKMYFVVDDTKLTTEAGYMVFSAGTAAAVPWSGITGKPSTFTPSAHTQAISTITGLQAALDNKFTTADMKAATADAAGTHGLVPAPAAGKQGQFLRGDGTWATPTNTTYNVFKGASASAGGGTGLVPAPTAANAGQFLKGDGTWATPTDTKYTHPTYTARSAGFYKVTVDGTGHVSNVANVTKADITGLGIPGQDTTYSVFKAASASAAGGTGLVPAPAAGKQTQFLRGDGTWATPTDTKYANATPTGAGLMSAADKTKLDAVEEWIIADSAPTKNCMWLKTS